MGVHDGHRDRLKKRFLNHGLDSFDDHNLLELLLFFAIPRRDTNPIAHNLMNKFGTLSRVFEASVEELCQVDGIGVNAALLIKMIPQMGNRYVMSKVSLDLDDILDNATKAGEYLKPRFSGERDEVVYMICMDSKCQVINTKLMFRGSVNSASISTRKIVENALVNNATRVIIAHNHVSGIALPSREDIETTRRIRDALSAVDVALIDHIVVVEDDYVSMAESGLIN